jgi:hypothetical protein
MAGTGSELAILVTNPQKYDQGMVGSYTTYKLTTHTTLDCFDGMTEFSVERRYSDFSWLRGRLVHYYPNLKVPALPEKTLMGVFSPEFVEARRYHLEQFLALCVEQPRIRQDSTFHTFLTADTEKMFR